MSLANSYYVLMTADEHGESFKFHPKPLFKWDDGTKKSQCLFVVINREVTRQRVYLLVYFCAMTNNDDDF